MQKPQEKPRKSRFRVSRGRPRDLWTDDELIEAYGWFAQMRGRPVYIGKLKRAGWTGLIRTYVIWCPPCRIRSNSGFTVAHEAGYARRLECSCCRKRYDQLLFSRRAKDALLNPHQHPRLIVFLILVAFLTAVALR